MSHFSSFWKPKATKRKSRNICRGPGNDHYMAMKSHRTQNRGKCLNGGQPHYIGLKCEDRNPNRLKKNIASEKEKITKREIWKKCWKEGRPHYGLECGDRKPNRLSQPHFAQKTNCAFQKAQTQTCFLKGGVVINISLVTFRSPGKFRSHAGLNLQFRFIELWWHHSVYVTTHLHPDWLLAGDSVYFVWV